MEVDLCLCFLRLPFRLFFFWRWFHPKRSINNTSAMSQCMIKRVNRKCRMLGLFLTLFIPYQCKSRQNSLLLHHPVIDVFVVSRVIRWRYVYSSGRCSYPQGFRRQNLIQTVFPAVKASSVKGQHGVAMAGLGNNIFGRHPHLQNDLPEHPHAIAKRSGFKHCIKLNPVREAFKRLV